MRTTRLFLLLLLLPRACLASFTNVVGLEVETNGWVLRATIGGDAAGSIGTNGNFFSGIETNYNSLTSTTALTLTVTSMGFDDNGNGIQVTRAVYGTKQLRAVYPMQNTNDIQFQDSGGTNVVFRIALSDYIYSRDSNITATALGGWISGTNGNGTNVAAISNRTVTNSSTSTYQSVIANWVRPARQLIQSSTMRLGAVGFHSSGQLGRPLRAMRFVAQDQHSNATTNWQTTMMIDYSYKDAIPFGEYVADMNISTFTNGDLIRCDFTGYPWVGDTNTAVFDTFNNFWKSPPNKLPVAITNVCDRLGAYGVAYAVVDQVNGSSAGVVTTNFNASSPPATFDSMNHAAGAIAFSNQIWFARSNAGAAIIYLTNGTFNWGGSARPNGNMPATYLTICPYPGVAQSSCTITGSQTLGAITGLEMVSNVNVRTTANTVWTAPPGDTVWFNSCTMSNASATTFGNVTNFIFTGSTITYNGQGLESLANGDFDFGLVRGNNLVDVEKITITHTYVGNLKTNSYKDKGGWSFTWSAVNSPWPQEHCIVYNNLWEGNSNGAVSILDFGKTQNTTNGFAYIQNVAECNDGITVGPAMIYVAADSTTTSTLIHNILFWNNTSIAGRQNWCYNDGSLSLDRSLCSVKNNNWDRLAIKTDTFFGAAAAIGNWSQYFGVAWTGNTPVGVGATIAFPQYFRGLNATANQQVTTNWYHYTRWGGYDTAGGTSGVGSGLYRLNSDSQAMSSLHLCDWVLPFDIEGIYRGLSDPPGAYASGNVKKGGFF